MSALTKRLMNAPKAMRIMTLLLLVALLAVIVVYAMLEYADPGHPPAPAPTTIAQITPTIVPASPTAAATKTSVPPTATIQPTETPLPASPTPTAEATEEDQPEDAGDMQALSEIAGPITTTLTTTPSPTQTSEPEVTPSSLPAIHSGNVIANSEFDQGFQGDGVAEKWSGFDNGNADFRFRSDELPWVKDEEGQTQIIRISDVELPDRYAGVYQTVEVVPESVYTFTISGLMRTNVGDAELTGYGYSLEIGFDTSVIGPSYLGANNSANKMSTDSTATPLPSLPTLAH
jgi:hypothetical protein